MTIGQVEVKREKVKGQWVKAHEPKVQDDTQAWVRGITETWLKLDDTSLSDQL